MSTRRRRQAAILGRTIAAAAVVEDAVFQAPLVIQQSVITGSSTLTDFTVLLTAANLPDDFKDADLFQSDGGDIRFFADEAGTTPIPCEIVNFAGHATPASATAIIWVKVPSISPTVDTTIYMRRTEGTGRTQPAADHAAGRNAVWSDYLFVHHGLNTTDSTGNGHTMVLGNANTTLGATGPWAGSPAINVGASAGNPGYMTFGSAASLDNLETYSRGGWIRLKEQDYPKFTHLHGKNEIGGADLPVYDYFYSAPDGGNFAPTFGNYDSSGAAYHASYTSIPTSDIWLKYTNVREADDEADGLRNYVHGFRRGGDTLPDSTAAAASGTSTVNDAAHAHHWGAVDAANTGLWHLAAFIWARSDVITNDWEQVQFANQSSPATSVVGGSVTEV